MRTYMRYRYEGQTHYRLSIGGLTRDLPVVQVDEGLWIASFVMLGDAQLVNVCAGALAVQLAGKDFEIMVGPEAKVVPLLQMLATLLGHPRYVVCRKSVKGYMQNPLSVEVESITTKGSQLLVIDGPDVELLRNRKVAIVDDVVSTGGSIRGVEELLSHTGAIITTKAAVLKEGDAYGGDLIYLADLPIFTA